MVIIKQGKIPKNTEKQLTCHNCNCIFEYSLGDIIADDIPCSMPYVICPMNECNEKVSIIIFKGKRTK